MILKTFSLTPEQKHIILDKGTEIPNSGLYNLHNDEGTYICKNCGISLFRSTDKFLSSCGWPSFDDEILGSIERIPDLDDLRTEILCQRCKAHLGHVFLGEGLTDKNLRHCVNSLSLDFVADLDVLDTEEGIFSGGCFWGVEHLFQQQPGVLLTESGYIGGNSLSPSYEEVCSGKTDYIESVRVLFNVKKITYPEIARLFFKIHDPTQKNGQGQDIGYQYTSNVFVYNQNQKSIIENLINELSFSGYEVATNVQPMKTFWKAEDYHQNYYNVTAPKNP